MPLQTCWQSKFYKREPSRWLENYHQCTTTKSNHSDKPAVSFLLIEKILLCKQYDDPTPKIRQKVCTKKNSEFNQKRGLSAIFYLANRNGLFTFLATNTYIWKFRRQTWYIYMNKTLFKQCVMCNSLE